MQILLRKLSDERHELAVSTDPASWDAVECETRGYLTHDLLHYAVEAEAGVQSGFWGRLAAGATLAEMNDRTRSMGDEMAATEQVVGALTASMKGRSAADHRRELQLAAPAASGPAQTARAPTHQAGGLPANHARIGGDGFLDTAGTQIVPCAMRVVNDWSASGKSEQTSPCASLEAR